MVWCDSFARLSLNCLMFVSSALYASYGGGGWCVILISGHKLTVVNYCTWTVWGSMWGLCLGGSGMHVVWHIAICNNSSNSHCCRQLFKAYIAFFCREWVNDTCIFSYNSRSFHLCSCHTYSRLVQSFISVFYGHWRIHDTKRFWTRYLSAQWFSNLFHLTKHPFTYKHKFQVALF